MQTHARELDEFAADFFRVLMSSIPSQRPVESQPAPNVFLPGGNQVTVAFTVSYGDAEALYGKDRRLLQWLLRRAIEAGATHVSWEMLLEYLGAAPTAPRNENSFSLPSGSALLLEPAPPRTESS
jgi:hypothetical protein